MIALTNANENDVVLFGTYPQYNTTSKADEPIEWIVLKRQGARILLISKKALDCQRYHSNKEDITWEQSTLRAWLNHDFYQSAFNEREQRKIIPSRIVNPGFIEWHTKGGKATTDRVFLLSIIEANTLFSSDDTRMCTCSNHACAHQGVIRDDIYSGNCQWWLRSPGGKQNRAAWVTFLGTVLEYGADIEQAGIGVRPALWIDTGIM